MKKNFLVSTMTIIVFIVCLGILFFSIKNRGNNLQIGNFNNTENKEDFEMDEIIIKVNGKILIVELENNSSSKAFVEKLKKGDITINTHDYGNFEKVGNLGFTLPRNDQDITTEAGDLILYLGNQITLYYDTNRWNFTRLGKVKNISQDELKKILGSGDVEMTFSLNLNE